MAGKLTFYDPIAYSLRHVTKSNVFYNIREIDRMICVDILEGINPDGRIYFY